MARRVATTSHEETVLYWDWHLPEQDLTRLDIGLIKFPIDGEAPKQYPLILIE